MRRGRRRDGAGRCRALAARRGPGRGASSRQCTIKCSRACRFWQTCCRGDLRRGRRDTHLPLARAATRRRRMHRERERSRGTRVAGAACCRNLGKADAALPDYFLKSRVPSARSAPSAAGSSYSSKQRRRAARRRGGARPQKGSHEQFDLLGRPQSSTVLVGRTVPLREARCEQGSFGEVNAGSRAHCRWPQAISIEASLGRRRLSQLHS